MLPAILVKMNRPNEAKGFIMQCSEAFPTDWRGMNFSNALTQTAIAISEGTLQYPALELKLRAVRDQMLDRE